MLLYFYEIHVTSQGPQLKDNTWIDIYTIHLYCDLSAFLLRLSLGLVSGGGIVCVVFEKSGCFLLHAPQAESRSPVSLGTLVLVFMNT